MGQIRVSESAVVVTREVKPGKWAEIAPRALFEMAGWPDKKENYEKVRQSMSRMMRSGVMIVRRGKGWDCRQLIAKASYDDGRRVWRVALHEEILEFMDAGWSPLSLRQLAAFPENRLARWLVSFYSTHKVPRPVPVPELHRICGSRVELYEFRRMLKDGMRQLKDEGVVVGWGIRNDQLHVYK